MASIQQVSLGVSDDKRAGELPPGGRPYVVLADTEGNRFCVEGHRRGDGTHVTP